MKLHSRITSMALALMVALSCAVAPAFAAPSPSLELSRFAGQEKEVHLVVISPDSTSQQEHDFTVAIPDNATVAQETALTNMTANAYAGITGARYAGTDLISHRGPFTISGSGSAQVVGGRTLFATLSSDEFKKGKKKKCFILQSTS